MTNQQPASNHRSLTGLVTKLVGDGATYGFINDEIFFPQTNVSNGPASVGDQVFADCEYSAHLPIKWNATSVNILKKAPAHQQRPDLQQQDIMNQPSFVSNNPVAVTYQQHRQQRQQRQTMDVDQDNINQQAQQQQNIEHSTKMLDSNTLSGDFYNSVNNRPFPTQQSDNNIQPFSDQPMGPPNFTYTSQLGSAFVQNQFVPTSFMSQQPPPMLPQQPQQQQHMLPSNQIHNQNNNQRHSNQQHNKGGMGNRFNNNTHGDNKNDRQTNRRNMNRNDNKFDRPRSGERDNHNLANNRSSKLNGGRERSIGGSSKRDEVVSRPSPPSHSSGRSTSLNSDRGTKVRRHYDVQNIPKTTIMINMSANSMKQRCPPTVHIPSDLIEVLINKDFRLDLKSTPKPLRFTIEQYKNDVSHDLTKVSTTDSQPKKNEAVESSTTAITNEETNKIDKLIENPTPPSSKSEHKLRHKYGVKVILISIKDLEEVYHEVFGTNLDSFSSDARAHTKVDETISILCCKGLNNGHSLIGGKFDPILDGFVEGENDAFERHGRKPDLIATCKRIILETTGLDLGKCKSWSLLSKFVYNHKSDYFSKNPSLEYSFIYIPHIWTLLNDKFDEGIMIKELNDMSNRRVEEETVEKVQILEEVDKVETVEEAKLEENVKSIKEIELRNQEQTENKPSSSNENLHEVLDQQDFSSVPLERLTELKVTDLKAELDKRGIKYKSVVKKAELVAILQEHLQSGIAVPDEKEVDTEVQQPESESEVEKRHAEEATFIEEASLNDCEKLNDNLESESKTELNEVANVEVELADNNGSAEKPNVDDTILQLEEGEVPTENNSPIAESFEMQAESGLSSKRKASASDNECIDPKKICIGDSQKNLKEERVNLVKDSFVVHSRNEQQQLSLVSLFNASQAARHDQFELSVASNILKESLVQHFSEYMLTTLIADHKQRTATSASGSQSSSQETCSDSNNNTNAKSTFKNPNSDTKISLKEFPVNRYINLAFSHFDSAHMGYIYLDDLNKLFNNTNLPISKRALMSLVGEGDKINYRTLPDLPLYVYDLPQRFERQLSGSSSTDNSQTIARKVIEYKGITYDVEKLIQQVNDADILRVSLVDRFNYAIENSDKQAEEIHVLEVSQKSLAKAIKAQNDEICDLKRERDSLKKKFDSVRKGVKGTITTLTDLIKEEK